MNPGAAATQDDIAACFRLLLGRPPGAEEWVSHRAMAGQPLAAVVQYYLDSPEHAARVGRTDHPETRLRLVQKEGFSIYADEADLAVGRHVAGGSYQPEIAALIQRFVKPGMAVVDIGANIGFFTMLAASLTGPQGHVLAVEPNPANSRMIEASRRANGFAHITVAGCAAGRTIGLLALATGFSNGNTTAPADGLAALFALPLVPSIPLGRLLPDRKIDVIKIDAEGAEYATLADVAGVLRRDGPVIISEFSPTLLPASSGVTGEEYLQFLTGLGYRLEVIEGEATLPCADSAAVMDIYRHNAPNPIDLLLTAAPRRRSWFGMLHR